MARSIRSSSSHPPSVREETYDTGAEGRATQHGAIIPERLPKNSNGFDWSEGNLAKNMGIDGMAVLTVDPQGAGYLG